MELAKATKIEQRLYSFLKIKKFDFDYQVTYFLTGPSIHKTAKVPLLKDKGAFQVKIIVDFVIRIKDLTLIVDTKGWLKGEVIKNGKKKVIRNRRSDYFNLKYNLLRHKLYAEGNFDHRIMFVETKKLDSFMVQLLAFRQGGIKSIEL